MPFSRTARENVECSFDYKSKTISEVISLKIETMKASKARISRARRLIGGGNVAVMTTRIITR